MGLGTMLWYSWYSFTRPVFKLCVPLIGHPGHKFQSFYVIDVVDVDDVFENITTFPSGLCLWIGKPEVTSNILVENDPNG